MRGERKYRRRIPEPITSYGLIVYSKVGDNNMFVLYQRRDNFEYMDFIRGIWTDRKQVEVLFSFMSNEERDRIRNYTFKELWDDLWVDHNCRIYRDTIKAKKKYDSIKPYIHSILVECENKDNTPPWGFPKGKKNGGETILQCAKREFEEETGISLFGAVIENTEPFIERFRGTNGKIYCTEYYLCRINNPIKPEYISTPQCIRKRTATDEAREVKWFGFEDAITHLNNQRKDILTKIVGMIE